MAEDRKMTPEEIQQLLEETQTSLKLALRRLQHVEQLNTRLSGQLPALYTAVCKILLILSGQEEEQRKALLAFLEGTIESLEDKIRNDPFDAEAIELEWQTKLLGCLESSIESGEVTPILSLRRR